MTGSFLSLPISYACWAFFIASSGFGTYSEEACDYADIALPVAEAVVAKEFDFGILICGTGIGIGIV